MNISTSYSSYYTQKTYSQSALSQGKISTGTADLLQGVKDSKTVGSISKKNSVSSEYGDTIELSMSGKLLREALQVQSVDDTNMSDKMEAIKADMEAIKTTDIDSVSADEAKEALQKLQSDLGTLVNKSGVSQNTSKIDIDSMSESQIKDTLKNIQEKSIEMSKMNQNFNNVMQQNDYSEIDFGGINEELSTIKGLEIDSMSTDKIKDTLIKLQDSLSQISNLDEKTQNLVNTNFDDMSDAQMKSLLQRVQDDLSNEENVEGTKPMGKMRPSGPPPGGPPPSSGVGITSDSDSTDQTYIEELLEALANGDEEATSISEIGQSLSSEFVDQLLKAVDNEESESISSIESSDDNVDDKGLEELLNNIRENQTKSNTNYLGNKFNMTEMISKITNNNEYSNSDSSIKEAFEYLKNQNSFMQRVDFA